MVTKQMCASGGGIFGHPNNDKDVANGMFHYAVQSANARIGHCPASQRNGLIEIDELWVRYGTEDPKESYSEFQKQIANNMRQQVIVEADI